MICMKIVGGLGNQMFQYAAGLSLANRLNTELTLDTREFRTYELHAFGLQRLNITSRIATDSDLKRWPRWSRKWCKRAHRFGLRTRWYLEPEFPYNPAWEGISDGTMLEGYFQSEKYFADIAPQLRREFTPKEALSTKNREYLEKIKSTDSVMLHVRRGDYASDPKTLHLHGLCSLDYYSAALDAIQKKHPSPHFFIFSNDLNWANENLPLNGTVTFVDGNDASPEMDIFLMSQCKHHIIANSSFSWWGAWLANHPEQEVFAPKQWFNALDADTRDLIPKGWNRL